MFALRLFQIWISVSLLVISMLNAAHFNYETTYEGKWNTTKNKKLDGRMTCKVTSLGDDKYRGKFYGTWQGSKFEYTVEFADGKGKANIDGVDYNFNYKLEGENFTGSFASGRYIGSFQLKEKGNKK